MCLAYVVVAVLLSMFIKGYLRWVVLALFVLSAGCSIAFGLYLEHRVKATANR